MKRLLLTAGLLTLGLATVAQADVTPNPLISDNMVLQAGMKCPLWGKAEPGEKVDISYKGKGPGGEAVGALPTVTADKDGKWVTAIDLTAKDFAGATLELTFKGKNTVTVKNALVGEVWVASGQSNMEWSVNASYQANQVKKAAGDNPPKMRLFQVQKQKTDAPLAETKGKWVEPSPDAVGGFSAVGYHFGKHLSEKTGRPVGMIQAAWGGTAAEEWTSRPVLEANPKHLDKHKDQAKLYNGMVAPIIPYGVRGAIWYQGESNTGRAGAYDELMRLLIKNWRDDWKQQGDFPFLYVQLAPFKAIQAQPTDTDWARLREAQLKTLGLPNTGMAVITDYGDEFDIHPMKKKPVGDRLALIARGTVYGEKVEYSGPMFDTMEVQGNKAVLSFTHAGKGLVAKGGTLTGFTVAGDDKVFHYAHAEIQGNKVAVWNDKVSKPAAVRFGWDDCPFVNLFNADGLPASPFRTDTWPAAGTK